MIDAPALSLAAFIDSIEATFETPQICRCGCAGAVARKRSQFLPGHDARLVSRLTHAMIAGGYEGRDIQQAINDTGDWVGKRFTPALAAKYDSAAMAAWDKAVNGKPKRAAKDDSGVIEGTVKVGRWTYPAQMFLFPGTRRKHVNINDARDGSGDWLDGEGYRGKPVRTWIEAFRPN